MCSECWVIGCDASDPRFKVTEMKQQLSSSALQEHTVVVLVNIVVKLVKSGKRKTKTDLL